MRLPALIVVAGFALAAAGCTTTESRNVKLNTLEAAPDGAEKVAGDRLIDAIFSGDFAAAKSLLVGGLTPEENFAEPFNMLHKAFTENGMLSSRELVATLRLSPYVDKLVYKLVLIDKGKDESGESTEVKSEILFVVSVICDAEGKVIVVDFRPVA